ncbi:MAG TPA: glucose-6-phosphate dehydrogenase, partial [Acidimicrobiales bacterium]|nr:glucose-6-phosphate dehydrogenase [Acidimicrobiales bacterium]
MSPDLLHAGVADDEKHPGPLSLIIFGASGDLTSRKILPAVASLADRGALPAAFTVVGVARTPLDDEGFRDLVRKATPDAGKRWQDLVANFRYVTGEYDDQATFDRLRDVLGDADRTLGTAGNRVFYLATIPSMFGPVAKALATHGCNVGGAEGSFARLVVEKPFGTDLATAEKLDAELHEAFGETDVYRIDHYMGKETVQNVLALRFANSIFEPVWNRRYVDHVQVTVAEQLGVEH